MYSLSTEKDHSSESQFILVPTCCLLGDNHSQKQVLIYLDLYQYISVNLNQNKYFFILECFSKCRLCLK